jgi:hypothetical protein
MARQSTLRGMARYSKKEQQQAAESLRLWSERPVSRTNARVLGITAIVVVMMLVGARHSAEPAGFVRGVAMAFAICQGSLHYVSLAVLRVLAGFGMPEAATALAVYRDPQRLSNLDMAMMWGLVAMATPYLA